MSVKFELVGDIGHVIFDHPESKVNLLDFATLSRLEKLLKEIANLNECRAVLFRSGKPGMFIAGADISQIANITDQDDARKKSTFGQSIMNHISDLGKPTVCLINGPALGGGCELALACQFRVATTHEKVKLGLPEVQLGILPGFGGCVRLPRLIGLSQALTMMLTGKMLDARKALRIGLIDKMIVDQNQLESITDFMTDVLSHTIHPQSGRYARGLMGVLDRQPLGHSLQLHLAERRVLKQSGGHYPAPLQIIDLLKELPDDRDEALQSEAEAFSKLAVSDECRGLIQVYFLREKQKRLGSQVKAERSIQSCAVIGAGVMGGGIAQLLAQRSIVVRMKDIHWDALQKGLQAAYSVFKKAKQRRKIKDADVKQSMGRISVTVDESGLSKSDAVIEAVVEDLTIKKQVLTSLAEHVPADALWMTNTSSLSVTEMGSCLKDPSRMIGFHFFNPVHRMPLLEIIVTPKTSQKTTDEALQLAHRLGKLPIVVKDGPGFVVNRILLAYLAEAGRLLEETGQLDLLDKVMLDFGLPMGPLQLSDEVGMDVGLKVLRILADALGPRFEPVQVFEKLVEREWLGKKTGQGFYVYRKPSMPWQRRAVVNAKVSSFLPKNRGALVEEIALDRMLLLMINEAAYCLQDQIADDPHSIDAGMIFGCGFPPFSGGLLRYADHMGLKKVFEKLERFQSQYGERFKPAPFLVNLVNDQKTFYTHFK